MEGFLLVLSRDANTPKYRTSFSPSKVRLRLQDSVVETSSAKRKCHLNTIISLLQYIGTQCGTDTICILDHNFCIDLLILD
jgi:hypothetical protein